MALITWVSVWMLMLPWVHIHPEVEHNHGDPAHAHHAVTHTVFSPPLECESLAHLHHKHDHCLNGHNSHVPSLDHDGYILTHPEIDFTLAASSGFSTIDKVILSVSLLIEELHTSSFYAVSTEAFPQNLTPTLLFLVSALPLRAPPTLFS
jgi:hypothetical protein